MCNITSQDIATKKPLKADNLTESPNHYYKSQRNLSP